MVHETRTARAARGSGRVRARAVITLIGVAALVVGAFLDWQAAQPGYRLTFRSLLHDDFATTANTTRSVGAISILIAAFALLTLLDRWGWLTRLAGLAAVVLFAMFALQLYRHSGQRVDPAFHAVRAGAWAVLGAGVVLLLGGLVRYRPKRQVGNEKQNEKQDQKQNENEIDRDIEHEYQNKNGDEVTQSVTEPEKADL
jgi:hypothetical protein